MLFTVVILWNRTESALDNDNKTVAVAHNHSSSSRLNENPLDGQTLLEPHESAAVKATNRADPKDEGRSIFSSIGAIRRDPTMSAAKSYLLQRPRPDTAFETLGIGKGDGNLEADEKLKIWLKYVRKYKQSADREGWYKPEKVFSLLVKTYQIDKVLYWFKARGMHADANKLHDMLSEDSSALRLSMDQQWLDSETSPDVVFELLGVGHKSLLRDPNAFHWIQYCDRFRQRYGDHTFSVEKILQSLQDTNSLGNPISISAFLLMVEDRNWKLTWLTLEMQEALHKALIAAKTMSPILAYSAMPRPYGKYVLDLPTSDPWYRALKGFTLAYARSIGRYEDALFYFDHEKPNNTVRFLRLISDRLHWPQKKD
uniref:RxLR effector candidate protein n=2 Tax=Hyaloperonospora arabidopsidis (strain Emoy2) TaxID=559515 RepID=M4BLG5_HYAAE